ncbi:MAG: prepilin-type N-terminal cleavage/methylation domain-containing protein [Phycisphaerales bacterium]|nr:prepilin-type N-terminal cleavage/methylation domain-containing protein [Phycisphaerales bacterium]
MPNRPLRHRGFTLVELMIAVAVLSVVVLATSKLFGTASKVAGIGEATQDVMQEISAIQRQMREDFAKITPDGFLVIKSYRVPNDINDPLPLLDPTQPADAIIRSDQVVFFTSGLETTSGYFGYRLDQTGEHFGYPQTVEARVSYGHGFQLPNAAPLTNYDTTDPGWGPQVPPWRVQSDLPMVNLSGSSVPAISQPQIQARDWVLARQAILLSDDAGARDQFLVDGSTSIFNAAPYLYNVDPSEFGGYERAAEGLVNSRLDIASQRIGDAMKSVMGLDPNLPFDYGYNQYLSYWEKMVREMTFFPRAERSAAGSDWRDQFTTTSVIGSACSSFIVEWTYDNDSGNIVQPVGQTRWFGARDLDRGVASLTSQLDLDQNDPDGLRFPGAPAIPPYNTEFDGSPTSDPGIESQFTFQGVDVYSAAFFPSALLPSNRKTPWPSALRITMTLHDTKDRLTNGRTVQFVVDLPQPR